jgi:hypothetical protein
MKLDETARLEIRGRLTALTGAFFPQSEFWVIGGSGGPIPPIRTPTFPTLLPFSLVAYG